MGIGNVGAGIASSLTGNISKALLIIDDQRENTAAVAPPLKSVGKAAGLVKLPEIPKPDIEVPSAPQGGSPPVNKKMFKVQFNPKELKIFAEGGSVAVNSVQNATNPGKKEKSPVPPRVSLLVKLVFDDVNIHDAFMTEKIGSSPTGAVKGAVALGRSLAGKVWSVRPAVEALLACLKMEKTRNITFQWAKFSFSGKISSISARYTMFSVSGEPIRATVDLRIQQTVSGQFINIWDDEFNEAFKSGVGGIKQNVVSNLTGINM